MNFHWLDGPTTPVLDTVFSPDGERLLTVAQDGAVHLWDAGTNELLATVGTFSESSIELSVQCTFSPNGELILIFDPLAARASLWDGSGGDFVTWLEEDQELVTGALFRSGGQTVVTGLGSGRLHLRDSWGVELLGELELSPTGIATLAPMADAARVLVRTRDGRASLWDIEKRELVESWGDDEHPIAQACADSSGHFAMTMDTSGRISIHGEDVDVELGVTHHAELRPELLSPDGQRCLVFTSELGPLALWDVERDESLATLLPEGTHSSWSQGCSFSPDGERIVTADPGAVRLWNGRSGAAIADLPGEDVTQFRSARFSPDGSRLAVRDANFNPRLFDGLTGELLGPCVGTWSSVMSLTFSPTSDRLAAGKYGAYAAVWSITDLLQAQLFRTHARLGDVSFDGDNLVAIGGDFAHPDDTTSMVTRVWDGNRGNEGRVLSKLNMGVGMTISEFHPDGSTIITAGTTLGLTPAFFTWSLASDKPARELGFPRMVPAADRPPFASHIFSSRDGTRVLGVVWSRIACLWDAVSGEQVRSLEVSMLPSLLDAMQGRCCALSPDGSVVAAAQEGGDVALSYDFVDETVSLKGHTALVHDLEFSPDGERLLSSSMDGTARIWNADSGKVLAVLEGHELAVWYSTFSPDGARVATASQDDTARIWNAKTGELLSVLAHDGDVTLLEFSADGERLLTSSTDGTARIWPVPGSGAAEIVKSPEPLVTLEGHLAAVEAWFATDGSRVFTSSLDCSMAVWDATTGELLMRRVQMEGDAWIAVDDRGYYMGSPGSADWIRMASQGVPLSSYADVLEHPEKVRATLRDGAGGKAPFLPKAPEITIASPLNRVSETPIFQLSVLLKDAYGIPAVTITQDGETIPQNRIQAGLGPGSKRGEWQLMLPIEIAPGLTKTILRMRATNKHKIKSVEKTVLMRHKPAARDLYLLAFGVGEYDGEGLDLRYPVNDVNDIVERFRSETGRLYEQVHVEVLTDREVTSGRIKRLRETFLLRAQPEDTIIVFAAGHGVRTDSGEYYFLTSGTTPDEPYDGIERQLLESLVIWPKLHAERRVLLLDTCQSGKAFGQDRRGVSMADAFDQQEVDDALGTGTGIYIMTATSDKGFARETEGNGFFTRALIDGLDGAADDDADGQVNVVELMKYAADTVHEKSAGQQRPRMPTVVDGTDFPLARSGKR